MAYVLENIHWFVLLIGALVFFHELGHFLVAKACNVKVLRFSMGFGPRLFNVTRGETEYSLSLLPLGGYVKMLGEAPGADVPAEESHRAFSTRPVWQRAAIVSAGPMFNMLLATTVYFCMFVGSHSFSDTRLGVVSVGDPAWQAGLRPGDRVTAVEGVPVDRWDALREQIASRPNATLRLTYERAGKSYDVALQTHTRNEVNVFQESESRGKIGISMQFLRPVLAMVDAQSPAGQAGLRTDDVIVAVQGEPVNAWHEVRERLATVATGQPVKLSVKRGEAPLEVTLQPAPARPELLANLFSAADTTDGYTGLVNKDSLVTRVDADSPAKTAGLQPGDRVLRLDIHQAGGATVHRPVGVWSIDLAPFGLDAQSQLAILYQRGAEVFERPISLQARDEQDEFKNKHTTYVFGAYNDMSVLDMYRVTRPISAWQAANEAVRQVGDDMTLISRGIVKMVRGSIPFDTMGGPIMLFVIAEKSAKRGLAFYFRTLAMISVNLGMLNLLPVPVLDGGHLLFCAIEVISRRPPSLRVRELANMAGLVLLLILMALVFRNDFLRFVLQ